MTNFIGITQRDQMKLIRLIGRKRKNLRSDGLTRRDVRIAELDTELDGMPWLSPKRRADLRSKRVKLLRDLAFVTKAIRKHKRAVDDAAKVAFHVKLFEQAGSCARTKLVMERDHGITTTIAAIRKVLDRGNVDWLATEKSNGSSRARGPKPHEGHTVYRTIATATPEAEAEAGDMVGIDFEALAARLDALRTAPC